MSQLLSYLLEDHSSDRNRSGEGAAVELKDGRLLLVYGRFKGGGDASPAELVSRISADGGRSWSEPSLFFAPEPGWVNAMSASLLRLADGRIAALFLVKLQHDLCVPYWTTSADEGVTWTPPRRLVDGHGYYVINNDRLVQLSDGRLLAPYAYSPHVAGCAQPLSGCLISDDGGESWRHGRQEIQVEPGHYHLPHRIVADATPPLRIFRQGHVCTQEPGVVELADGRVMMWARSNGGCAYAALSEDRGDHWSPYECLCPIPMANGPATIKRLPGTRRLVMLHNDRSDVPFGDPTFSWRTPLAVSTSDDEGRSWRPHAPLIADTSHNYCYASLCFFGGKALVSTYESLDVPQPEGGVLRRNLHSLRLVVVENDWFARD
ncbi:MAG: exo-alpha-sialidase [Lentisphaerae bacterium]|nr:exo-alpha-sialidase [Lentisphaerota bacterium]